MKLTVRRWLRTPYVNVYFGSNSFRCASQATGRRPLKESRFHSMMVGALLPTDPGCGLFVVVFHGTSAISGNAISPWWP